MTGSSKVSSKELERVDQLFYGYANNSLGMIDPEGIEKLCSEMEIDHTDIRILMLAWKMQAEKPGYFTLEEWSRCLKPLRVDTIAKLKKVLPELENEALLKLVSECSSLALNPTRKDALNQSPLKIVMFALAKMCAHSPCRQVLRSSDLFVAISRLKQSPDSTIPNYAAIICDKMGA